MELELELERWNALPEDLLLLVSALLDFRTLSICRVVCKGWSSILSPIDTLPWLCIGQRTQDGKLIVWDPDFEEPHLLPCLSFGLRAGECLHGIATDGGLLCFCYRWWWRGRGFTFLITNPLSGLAWQLRPMARRTVVEIVGLVLDKQAGTFKVVVGGHDLVTEQPASLFYDSRTDSWQNVDSPYPGTSQYNTFGAPIVINSTLYWLSSRGCVLLAYHTANGVWSEISTLMPASGIRDNYVVGCEGRLLLVGGLRGAEPSLLEAICVWELESKTSMWTEVDRMPSLLFAALTRGYDVECVCTGHKDFVLISTMSGFQPYGTGVLCNLRKKSWKWMASQNLPYTDTFRGGGYSFEARVGADLYFMNLTKATQGGCLSSGIVSDGPPPSQHSVLFNAHRCRTPPPPVECHPSDVYIAGLFD